MNINDEPTQPWQPEEETESSQGASTALTSPPPQSAGAPPSAVSPRKGMSRRKMLGATALGLVGLGAATTGGVALAEWLQHRGAANLSHGPIASNAQVGHLLRRAGFGAAPEDLTTYANLGYSGAVDRLLNYQQVSDNDMENRLKALNLDLNKPVDQQRWWLMRMAWTQRPLLEKMTLFWHGVLVSSYRKVGGARAYMRMINQNQFLRAHAFDTYDNILLGITADPAMLFYLDLTKSTKQAPNENYARELMELFTLGLGNYTQQDVYEGAAALTGWHIRGLTSYYNPADHNDLTKHYLGQTGNLDYKDVIRILTNHPKTPWFISRKLFTFFVYENPSNDDLQPLVDTYVQSNHNMGAVMKTLLLSPQFSSTQAYRNRIKSPVEFVVGAYRAMNRPGDGTGINNMTIITGQTLLDPPNVAGWPGDKVSSLWLNSGTWMSRLNYLDQLLARGAFAKGKATPPDIQGIVNANHIDTPERFVDFFASVLLDGTIDSNRRAQFIDYFKMSESGSGGGRITLTNGQSYPLNRVRGTLYLMMASPEYQLN